MKLLNDIISNVGYDKILHFLVAYIAVKEVWFYTCSLDFTALAVIAVCVLSIVKEFALDTDTGADFMDMAYGYIGSFVAFLEVLAIIV